MVKLTMIARVTDGLPLAEGLDDGLDLTDAEMCKQQVKALFKNLSKGHNEASRMSVETGPYVFQQSSSLLKWNMQMHDWNVMQLMNVLIYWLLKSFGLEEKARRLRSNELKLERQLENSQAEISSFKLWEQLYIS
ncbi:hypothetical protein GOBAR_DD10448 [Gossypium barbadense]|nr:hypothetical protein GOBAR_DD10448 [Gossypium barbadense]